jgi:hypothetical protein
MTASAVGWLGTAPTTHVAFSTSSLLTPAGHRTVPLMSESRPVSCSVPTTEDVGHAYLNLLAIDGTMIAVGVPEKAVEAVRRTREMPERDEKRGTTTKRAETRTKRPKSRTRSRDPDEKAGIRARRQESGRKDMDQEERVTRTNRKDPG